MTSHSARVGATRRPFALLALLVLGFAAAFALAGASAAKAAAAEPEELDASVEVYRLYHPRTGEHLLTADANERDTLAPGRGWRYEGIGFRAPKEGVEIHRLYDTKTQEHLYTSDKNEIRTLTANGRWTDEGMKFHGSATPTQYAVYRLYKWNPNPVAAHHWTLDTYEYGVLPKQGWTQEGVKWYATGPFEQAPEPKTALEAHGALQVEGSRLVDAYGEPIQLRGMSTHGLSFAEEGVPFKDYVNQDAFQTLRDDWGANCVRLAMYTDNYMGYCAGGNREELKGVVRRGVNAAKDLGMYAIVDWHILENGNPCAHEGEAREFFSQMSAEFKDYGNVLYEICNEPNGGVDWWTIKGYAERIIPVIRANDPDAVVIVGTPTWSQDVDQAAANRLTGDVAKNTMYALHFYANTHTQWLRDRMVAALDSGLPVFVSEFGTCDASGNGGLNTWESQQWINLLNSRGVSWMNWSLCLKNETASAIQPWCKKLSWWEPWELTDSGRWVRDAMRAAAGWK